MLNWISRFWRTSVIGSFLAGLLFLMPIVLTVVIVGHDHDRALGEGCDHRFHALLDIVHG